MIVDCHRADIDSGHLLPQALMRDTGVFQAMPGLFEQEPLLRVHAPRLTGRDSEQLMVEFIDLVQQSGPLAVGCAVLTGVRGIIPVGIPSVRGNFSYTVFFFCQVCPELLTGRSPGQSTRHTDDRYSPHPIPTLVPFSAENQAFRPVPCQERRS